MSRVFRRPMFRKGGNVGEGIMTGIRDNYAVGGSAEEQLAKIAEKYPEQGFDPLTQFLIQGGLNLVSQPSTGGVLSDIATAAKDPTEQLFKGMAEKGKLARELAIAGKQIDIEQAGKERLQKQELEAKEAMLERQLAATGDEQLNALTDTYMRQRGYDFIPARNMAIAQRQDIPAKIRSTFGESQYGGVIEPGTDLNKFAKRQGKKDGEGLVFIDLTDGKTKQLRKTTEGEYVFKPVSVEQQKIEEGVTTPPPGEEKVIGEEIETVTTDTIPEPKFRNMEEYEEYLKEQQKKIFRKIPVEELGANKSRSGRG